MGHTSSTSNINSQHVKRVQAEPNNVSRRTIEWTIRLQLDAIGATRNESYSPKKSACSRTSEIIRHYFLTQFGYFKCIGNNATSSKMEYYQNEPQKYIRSADKT